MSLKLKDLVVSCPGPVSKVESSPGSKLSMVEEIKDVPHPSSPLTLLKRAYMDGEVLPQHQNWPRRLSRVILTRCIHLLRLLRPASRSAIEHLMQWSMCWDWHVEHQKLV